jgi:hypothetical protein
MKRSCACGDIHNRGERCPKAQRRWIRKASSTKRGYNAEYAANRAAMIDMAWERGWPCIICTEPFNAKSEITAEHIVPLRIVRDNSLRNLAPAHYACNSSRRKHR